MSEVQRPRIGELLVHDGLVSAAQLSEALERQKREGGKIVENLISLRYIDQRAFLRFLSRQPGMASIELQNYTIPQEVLDLVDPEFALTHEILPIDRMGKYLTVAMACPLDSASLRRLEEMSGLRVKPLLVGINDIQVALKRYFGPRQTDKASFEDFQIPSMQLRNTALKRSVPRSEPPPAETLEPAPNTTPEKTAPPAPVVAPEAVPRPMDAHEETAPPVKASRSIEDLANAIPKQVEHPLDEVARELEVALEESPGVTGSASAPIEDLSPAPEPPAAVEPELDTATSASPRSAEVAAPFEVLQQIDSALTFERILHLVRGIDNMPALPETVRQVREAMAREDVSTVKVGEIIARDPAITAKVLSLANSSAYGFPHRVGTIELAATLLGLREIYSVVLSSSVIDFFSESKHFDYDHFWRRSLLCGISARVIAKACGRASTDASFSAGLLHDLGRAVFAEVVPERYASMDQRQPDPQLIEAELKEFGIAHPEVGFVLADAWELPQEILQAIRFHNDPERAESTPELAAVVGLAAMMTDSYGQLNKETVGGFARSCQGMLRLLGLSDRQFVAILGQSSAAIKAELSMAQSRGGAT